MELNYEGSDHKPPLTFPPPNFSSFPTQPLPGDLRWGSNGSCHTEGPNSAIEMSQFMWREMEKEKIREEIMMESAWTQMQKERIREEVIVDEIVRRRLLEADVRREFSIQRELALRGGGGFDIGQRGVSAPLSTCEMGEAHLGQRFATYHDGRLGMPSVSSVFRCESGGLVTGMQMSAEPQLGIEKLKEFIVLPAKPLQDVNVCERTSACFEKRQLREEFSCALCHVTATCEQDLNVHLQGERHKAKEAGLRKGKKYKIGWVTKSTTSVSSDFPSMGSKLWKKRDQNISKSAELGSPSQDPNNAKRKDYSFDECGKNSGSSVRKTKNSTGNKNGACKLLYEANHAGLETFKEKEEPSAGTNLAQVQEGNQQNTQILQVIRELNVSKKDSNDGDQLEEEENLARETSSKIPEKRDNPLKIISQQFNNLTVDGKVFCDGEEIASGNSSAVVRHVELEGQKEKVADIDSEISSVNPGKSVYPLKSQQLGNSVSNSGTPIARKLENKKKLLRFWCDMCQIGTDTAKVMEIHQTGKKHLALKKQMFGFWCDVCQIGADTKKVMEIHKAGKKHLSQARLPDINQNLGNGPLKFLMHPIPGAEAISLDPNVCRKKQMFRFWCDVCEIGADTEKKMAIHKAGKKHLSQPRVPEINQNAGNRPPNVLMQPINGADANSVDPNVCMKKNVAPVRRMKKTGGLDKNTSKFWCDSCHVGADSREEIDAHWYGKKHQKVIHSLVGEKSAPSVSVMQGR